MQINPYNNDAVIFYLTNSEHTSKTFGSPPIHAAKGDGPEFRNA